LKQRINEVRRPYVTMESHAVTLSVLVTQGHRFSLIHNILFCDQT